jgi:hypothetical protein
MSPTWEVIDPIGMFFVEFVNLGFRTIESFLPDSSYLVSMGGYCHFKQSGLQLLFAYGYLIAGQTENHAYLGLYKTWAKDKDGDKKDSVDSMRSAQPH